MSERCHNTFIMGHENGGVLKQDFRGKLYCPVCSQPHCPDCKMVMTYLKTVGDRKAGFECLHCLRAFNDMQTEIRHD